MHTLHVEARCSPTNFRMKEVSSLELILTQLGTVCLNYLEIADIILCLGVTAATIFVQNFMKLKFQTII